jgi:arylsulfatase
MPGAPKGFGGGGVRPDWAELVPARLQAIGYRTYHSGKWHIDGKPIDNGFELSDEATRSAGFFDSIKRANRDPEFYRTTATAQHAIDCLKRHAAESSGQPFFQYLAFHAPHFPLHALPEDIAKYETRYLSGWEEIRQQRHARQVELGISTAELSALEPAIGPPYAFPEQIELLGPGEVNHAVAWESLTEEQQRFQATKMAIHAAMVDRMDQEIGRVLEQLEAMKVLDNTFICFLSDNGASAEIMVRGEGHDTSAPPGSAATYLCLGPGFSSAANTPFRRHKTWVHEGGISTPFIAHWPAGIESQNQIRQAPAHAIDIVPTVLDLAGVDLASIGGPPLPGKSLRAALDDSSVVIHDEIWFYHEGNWALRQGDWKIIHSNDSRPFPWGSSKMAANELETSVQWQLFNLAEDRGEQVDLASEFPDRVSKMAARWDTLRLQFLEDAASGRNPRK